MTHAFADSSAVKALVLNKVQQAHDLTHQAVVVGDVFEPVVVASETQSDDSKHEDVPKIHPRAASLLLIPNNLAFEECKKLFIDLGSFENPLQPGENWRQFITAIESDGNALDGSLA
jgi:hypothetical protein